MPTRFPNEIREYRLKAGLSQKALAALLGKGRPMISAWERGRRLPTLPSALRLAKSLNTLAESLYWRFYSPEDGTISDRPRP
jgi:putative transcriptional regulator